MVLAFVWHDRRDVFESHRVELLNLVVDVLKRLDRLANVSDNSSQRRSIIEDSVFQRLEVSWLV